MKKLNEGRSMIEMLGVLAIIGVLSIGGLAGYTMAMNRHRANQILDYISRCAVIAQTSGDSGDYTKTCATLMPDETAPSNVTGDFSSVNCPAGFAGIAEDAASKCFKITTNAVGETIASTLTGRSNSSVNITKAGEGTAMTAAFIFAK